MPTHATTPEHQLLLRWGTMRPRVVAKLRSMGLGEADAEDLFSQALLRAWERRGGLRDVLSAEAWFWQMARRLGLDELRRRRRRPTVAVDEATAALAAPEPAGEPCACSLRMLEELPEAGRDLIRAVDIDGEAVREVAARAGISANNASVRLHRARRTLRRKLHDTCGTTSVVECQDCGCPP